MSERFRMAVSYKFPRNMTVRPPLPKWLMLEHVAQSTRNQKRSFEYWTQIYWATPPWINEDMIHQMKMIYLSADDKTQVDHIVPLKHPLVCGLHVPWNLQHTETQYNQSKSNHFWPDCPFEQHDLFGEQHEPYITPILELELQDGPCYG